MMVSGKKILVSTVKTFIVEFIFESRNEEYASWRCSTLLLRLSASN